MMMNIRGLAFDDPNGTSRIRLSTIEFQLPIVVTLVDNSAEDEKLGF